MLRFKSILPKSLFGRFLLIIIIPTMLSQLVATYVFYQRHWTSVSRNMAASLAGEVSSMVKLTDGKSEEDKQRITRIFKQNNGLSVTFKDSKKLGAEPELKNADYAALHTELDKLLDYPFIVKENSKKQLVLIEIKAGEQIYQITASLKRLSNPTTYIYSMWMVGTSLILLIISILFTRNQIRPISKLAKAAERFGKGDDADDFKPRGAREVRQAASEFIKMKDRINRQINQRTAMLAGVSHDLRTPLTRMKLQLNIMKKSPEIEELLSDIDEMQKMLEGYLNFAKGREAEETTKVNLADFLIKIKNSYHRQESHIELHIEDSPEVSLRYHQFRRAISNLIDNSLRFGENVSVTLQLKGSMAEIVIDDDGPGIPVDKRDDVFKPFFRLESSRNQETGGIGLGLTITRDIINYHGGEIILTESPKGGLRSIITIPV